MPENQEVKGSNIEVKIKNPEAAPQSKSKRIVWVFLAVVLLAAVFYGARHFSFKKQGPKQIDKQQQTKQQEAKKTINVPKDYAYVPTKEESLNIITKGDSNSQPPVVSNAKEIKFQDLPKALRDNLSGCFGQNATKAYEVKTQQGGSGYKVEFLYPSSEKLTASNWINYLVNRASKLSGFKYEGAKNTENVSIVKLALGGYRWYVVAGQEKDGSFSGSAIITQN